MSQKLFLVGTPIGNLEDMTFRAVKTLKAVPTIVAEDTRHARILCDHFGIGAKLVSMPAFSEADRAEGIVRRLIESGEDWAMVSDAGMPGISDPGAFLVKCAIDAGVDVVPIPGPSAAVTALSASGLPTARFHFVGFLPRKGGRRKSALTDLKRLTATIVIYESPERLHDTLDELLECFGDRSAAVCRELTKLHEEFVRGTLSTLRTHFSVKPRGEITLIVAGADETEVDEKLSQEELVEEIRTRLKAGTSSVKEIASQLAQSAGLKKNEVYALVLQEKASCQGNANESEPDAS